MQGFNKKAVYMLFFLFGFIIIALNFVISYINLSDKFEKDFLNDSRKTLQFDETMIQNNIQHLEDELRVFVKSPFMTLFLKAYSEDDKEMSKINNIRLVDLAKSHGTMMQVRYICNNGNEIVRVERQNPYDEPVLVSDNKLQNKQDRYYFKEVRQLEEGSVWYSKIDLNVEQGKIEVPYKPTLRIGIPVFTKGKRDGMLIFNIFMQPLLDKLEGSKNFDLYLTDSKGNFLIHTDSNYNWSHDLNREYTLFDELPMIASQILQNTVSTDQKEVFSKEFSIGKSDKYYLVAKMNSELIQGEKADLIQTFFLIGIVVMIIAIPLGMIFVNRFENLTARLRAIIDSLGDGIFVLNKERKISYVNNKAIELLEYSSNELIGRQSHERLQHRDAEGEYIAPEDCPIYNVHISGKQVHDDSNIFVCKSGRQINVEYTTTPFYVSGKFEGAITIFRDITARIGMEKKLEKLASTDHLTGLFNRLKFEENLIKEIGRSRRYAHPLSLIMFDIDYFKKVNDTFGHAAGDMVLKEISYLVKSHIRESDILARWGGEEFMLLTPEVDTEEAYLLAEKLRHAVNSFVFPQVGHISCSLGIVELRDGEDSNALCERVDKALYKAKESGRNCTVKA